MICQRETKSAFLNSLNAGFYETTKTYFPWNEFRTLISSVHLRSYGGSKIFLLLVLQRLFFELPQLSVVFEYLKIYIKCIYNVEYLYLFVDWYTFIYLYCLINCKTNCLTSDQVSIKFFIFVHQNNVANIVSRKMGCSVHRCFLLPSWWLSENRLGLIRLLLFTSKFFAQTLFGCLFKENRLSILSTLD